VERAFDRSFGSGIWRLFNRSSGSPRRPHSSGKSRWVTFVVLRKFISDPRLLSAGLLVSAAMYFSASWKTVRHPVVELPLNFLLGVIGVLSMIIPITKIRGSCGYVRRLKSAGKRRKHDTAMPSSPRLARDLPFTTRREPFLVISVARAWQHIFHSWKGERVFETELGRYDHALLYLASLGTTALLFAMILLRRQFGPWLWFPPNSPLQYLFDAWFCVGVLTSFGPGHYRAHLSAESVSYNTRAFTTRDSAVIDSNIWSIVKKFEAATGWRTQWSDNPNYLVGTDRSTCTLVLGVGWIVRSTRAGDKRRAGYLVEVLRLIRHAIDKATDQPFA
jgi:hypothetical protein